MDNQENFEIWLTQKFGENNGTKSSYLKAIEMISEKLKKNVFKMSDSDEITALYEDLKREQRNTNSKYFNFDAPSYGAKGFYSASVKNYLEFIKSV